MSLPDFVKQGSVLSTPAWLSGVSNKLIYPRIFDNDAYRSTLTGLPAERWSMLFSSDHSAGTGYIGRADSDDLEGPWVDSGAFITSGVNQRETPHPVYDPLNDRVNVYVHDQGSTVTYGSQSTRLLTSSTLAASSFTDQGDVMAYGHHTGYAQVYWDATNSLFRANHIMNGNEAFFNAHSTSADGETFTLGRMVNYLQQHVSGYGKCFDGSPFTFQHGGQWYALATLRTIPRLGGQPANASAIVAYPIASQSDLRATGGYYTLVTPSGTTTDPDYRLTNYNSIYEDGGALYLFYSGINNAGDRFICLAISDVGTASQTAPIIAPETDGTINHGTPTTIFDWDAANDAFPTADLTMTATSGSNNSSQSAGNYYEMKYGSGSTQDLRLTGDTTFDPRDHDTIELEIEGLTFDVDPDNQCGVQIGFVDSITTFTRGCLVNWNASGGSTNLWGRLLVRNGSGANVTDAGVYAIPWNDTDTSLGEWMRSQSLKVTLRITESGDKMILLVNDCVSAVRDLSTDGLTWTSGIFPYLRILSSTPHPEFYARFTRMSVKTYVAASPPANTVAPAVTGTEANGKTLTSTSGTWSGAPAPTYAYQWYTNTTASTSGGTAIASATSSTFVLTDSQDDLYVYCVVSATNENGSDAESSNVVGPILGLNVVVKANPTFADVADFQDLTLLNEAVGDAGAGEEMPVPSTWETASPVGDVDWSAFTLAVDAATINRSNRAGATLISPNYVVLAAHAPGDNTGHTWMTPAGSEVTRTLGSTPDVDYWELGTGDLAVAKLSAPINNITPMPMILDCSKVAGRDALCIEMDRHLNVFTIPSTLDNTDANCTVSHSRASDGLESGDSGKPCVIIIDDTPVMVITAMYTASPGGPPFTGTGPNASHWIDDIFAITSEDGESPTVWDLRSGDDGAVSGSPGPSPTGSASLSPTNTPIPFLRRFNAQTR